MTQQIRENNISTLLDTCTQMKVYLFETKRGGFNIYLFPNEPTQDILGDYQANFRFFTANREVVDYSQIEMKKETIQKLPTSDLPQWSDIEALINDLPLTNTHMFAPDKVTKKIKMVVVECTTNSGKIYLVSKFSHKTVYGKKIRFSLFQNTFKKLDSAVHTLGESIDCFIYNNEAYILIETHFNSLFDFYKRIKEEVDSNIQEIDNWDFFDNNTEIGNEVSGKARKGRQFIKAINSEDIITWKGKTPTELKGLILGDEKLRDKFQFDNQDRIIYSKDSLSELFKLLTNDYFKSLITEKTGER